MLCPDYFLIKPFKSLLPFCFRLDVALPYAYHLPSGKPKVLCNPTEGALILWLESQGMDYAKLRSEVTVVEELPFATQRKHMATVVRTKDGKRILYVKGAPEKIFAMCRNHSGMTQEQADKLLAGYQAQAMRTLGFAYQDLGDGETAITR